MGGNREWGAHRDSRSPRQARTARRILRRGSELQEPRCGREAWTVARVSRTPRLRSPNRPERRSGGLPRRRCGLRSGSFRSLRGGPASFHAPRRRQRSPLRPTRIPVNRNRLATGRTRARSLNPRHDFRPPLGKRSRLLWGRMCTRKTRPSGPARRPVARGARGDRGYEYGRDGDLPGRRI